MILKGWLQGLALAKYSRYVALKESRKPDSFFHHIFDKPFKPAMQ